MVYPFPLQNRKKVLKVSTPEAHKIEEIKKFVLIDIEVWVRII